VSFLIHAYAVAYMASTAATRASSRTPDFVLLDVLLVLASKLVLTSWRLRRLWARASYLLHLVLYRRQSATTPASRRS